LLLHQTLAIIPEISSSCEDSLAKPLSAKADRFCYGLKVRLRLKPPE
jgi:hypothetical protein